ncbi:MAG: type II toxin-antitoxin system RelE/ParE family toxin [Thermodesulfobacteriota bacterium]
MIKSFRDINTEKVFLRQQTRKFDIKLYKIALRKLLILDAAETLNDLQIPPGNRLEKLKGKRKDQLSIRINNQWRICFKWQNGNAFEVEITDYH